MTIYSKFDRTASADLQNKINTSIIFNYLKEKKSDSRANISRALKISAPSVSKAMVQLIDRGYVLEAEKMKTKSGKRPTVLKINKDISFSLGIDLGKERIKIAVANFTGDVIERKEGPKIDNNLDIVKVLILEINRILKKHGGRIKKICIATPGIIDNSSSNFLVPFYRSWSGVNFKELFEKEFKLDVIIENDVKIAAIGEKYYGEGKKVKDFVFLSVCNGIAAGIIINSQLYRGVWGSAGEVGFSIINEENLSFEMVNKGFLEKFASVESLAKIAKKEITNGKKTLIINMADGDINKINPDIVCKAATKGDKLAQKIIGRVNNYLAITIINLILILNPRLIVIGGDICHLPEVQDLFIERIIEKVSKIITFHMPEIKLSSIGEDAALLGACYIANESLMVQEFPFIIDTTDLPS
jgi:predicted NBD/HSP70 family sugar kinase